MSSASDFIIENGVLKKYVGPGGDVVVPDHVTKIEFGAFYCNSSISSVVFPAGLKEIGREAFNSCTQLSSITLPESLQMIGAGAFASTAIREVIIPKSVKSIGDGAFSWIGHLQQMNGEFITVHDGNALPHIKILGKPKIGKLILNHTYTVDDYYCGKLNQYVEVDDSIPLFPLVISWTELCSADVGGISAGKGKAIWELLRNPEAFRKVDQKYLADCARKSQKTLYPVLLRDADAQQTETFFSLGLVDAGNAETVLELLKDRPEQRTILLASISKHISPESREAAEEKKIDQEIIKQVKRANAVEEAIALFEAKKPADIKKEWVASDSEGGLRIEQYKGKDVRIVIPAMISKKAVIAISDEALRASAGDEGKKTAYQKKMYKNKCIVIQDGITLIGARAFMGCVYLTDCVLPGSVTEIGTDAFKDCHKLTIHAPAGSYAEQYAKENNILFVAE